MTASQLLPFLVEGLFAVVFLRASLDYARRRDPVSRDVALTFSPFVGLLLIGVWRVVLGSPPGPLSLVSGLLFFAQPLFALHLVSLIRPVPRSVLILASLAVAGSVVPLYVFRGSGVVVLAPLVVFALVQLVTAGYLAVESRRRRGPGGRRLGIAAAGTVGLACALLALSAGALGPDMGEAARDAGLGLALLSGCAYLVAFVPPMVVRRVWQASPTVAYQEELLRASGSSLGEIWGRYARLAAAMTGSSVAVVEYRRDGPATFLASDGVALPSAPPGQWSNGTAPAAGQDTTVEEVPIATLSEDDPIRVIGDSAAARFVSIVPIGEDGWGRRLLVVASSHRDLFHRSDLELLATLGEQTGIVAERQAILMAQEDMSARLSETVDALRSASHAKSDFLASMSHELRTPLSAILGFSDLMRSETATDGNVSVPTEWVEHIHRGGEHLLALVNDVLDLSKVEAGRMELRFESIDLAGAVREMVNGLRPLADRKDLTIITDVPSISAVADRGRLRQVVYNLVSNAIKFTQPGGQVRIAGRETTDGIELTVADDGIGIAPADLPLIFDEFRQVGPVREREGGTGLGLALARRLIEAHDGTIEARSTLGQGTTLTVTLPRRTATHEAAPAPTPPVAGADPVITGEILIIEDDPSAARLLREYLEPLGHTVRCATDGEQGMTLAREHRPIAILLDVLLPRVDGWEVLRRLKADVTLRDTPVIMVTVVDERDVGVALGAVDYLVKPVQRGALLASLARLGIAPRSAGRAARILTVDDEPAALDMLDGFLAGSGYEVVRAAGGREALEAARETDVDLVICDLVMPDLDGFGVIAELKSNAETAAIPILICTAHDLSDADKARLHGQILGVVSKGSIARDGLRGWLARVLPAPIPARLRT
jgi:signal transduction histidine kinase/CheY-like chemotaxis protein